MENLTKKLREFANERDWEQFHSPKNLSMAITIEAAELMEIFQWMTVNEAVSRSRQPELMSRIEEEVADIAIYVLSLCNSLGLDLSASVSSKIEKNRKKAPAQTMPTWATTLPSRSCPLMWSTVPTMGAARRTRASSPDRRVHLELSPAARRTLRST